MNTILDQLYKCSEDGVELVCDMEEGMFNLYKVDDTEENACHPIFSLNTKKLKQLQHLIYCKELSTYFQFTTRTCYLSDTELRDLILEFFQQSSI